jgi:opacity protein-like surface antigen
MRLSPLIIGLRARACRGLPLLRSLLALGSLLAVTPAQANDVIDPPPSATPNVTAYGVIGAGDARAFTDSGRMETLGFGLRLRDFAAAELTAYEYGTFSGPVKLRTGTIPGPVKAEAGSGSLLLNTPEFWRLRVFIRYGNAFSHLRDAPHGHDENWAATYGAGGQLRFAKNFALRLEYQRLENFAQTDHALRQTVASLIVGF